MHEMSIAVDLLRQVLASAEEHHVRRVEKLEVTAGVVRQIVPEALEMAFAILSEGTLAEGAALTVTIEPAQAQCRNCEEVFPCSIDDFCCPGCGQANARLTMGNDIVLTSMVCSVDTEPSGHEDQRDQERA